MQHPEASPERNSQPLPKLLIDKAIFQIPLIISSNCCGKFSTLNGAFSEMLPYSILIIPLG
jgi:hypothetical protein